MDYEQKYKDALGWMQSLYKGLHGATKEDAEHYFPELKESEEERMRKAIICILKGETGYTSKEDTDKYVAWLERQQPLDKEELAEGALKHVARQFMNWLDASTPEDKMCLSNMECKDIEDAFLKDDWARIANYIKKKIEKQGKKLNADEVIEWIKTHGNFWPVVTIRINDVITKFKKDFGL